MPLVDEYDRFSSFLCICSPSYKSKGSDQKLSEVPSSSDIPWFQDVRFLLKLSKHSQGTLSRGSGECICQGAAGRGETSSQAMRQHGNSPNHKLWPWTHPGNTDAGQLCTSSDESSQERLFWNPPQPRDLCHRLQSLSGPARTWRAAKSPPARAECQGFSFVLQTASPLNNAVWWQRYYHPELKYTPVMRPWKQSLQVCVANAEEANS